MQDFEIKAEPIELYKLLKFAGIADSGGEAKAMVAEGLVAVNGDTETQKRKKVVAGDLIQIGEETIRVALKTNP